MIEPVREALLNPFLLPSSRTYWVGLLATLFIAVVYHQIAKPSSWSRKNLLRLSKSSSVKLDVQLFFGRQLLRLVLGTPVWFSAWLLATKGVRWMDATFGQPELTHWNPLTISIVYTISLFVIWDLSRFALHWLMHNVPALWAFHQVHHSAEVLTPLTFHRIHPVESWLYEFRSVLTTGCTAGLFYWLFRGNITQFTLFGVPGLAFLLNVVTGNLRHSHVWIRYPAIIERWFISPAQHQIHHGIEERCYGKNYGTWLAIWDRMMGTLQVSDRQPEGYGIPQTVRNHEDNLLSAWFSPFKSALPWRSATLAAGVAYILFALPARAQEETDTEADQSPKDSEESSAFDEEIIIYDDEDSIRVAGSAHKVDQEQLELFERDDIEAVLRQVPGVVTRGEDGFGLRPNIGIRGANSDRSAKITLMEDGILLAPAPYAAPAAYYFPMNTRMVGVEVFKGAAATRHGPQTVGGAINVLTRDVPNAFGGHIDQSVGLRNTSKTHVWLGGSGSKVGTLFEAVHLRTSGFKELDTGGDTGFNHTELMWKSQIKSAQHTVELKLGYTNETSLETYLGLTEEDWSNTPYRRYAASSLGEMVWNRTQAHLVWAARPKPQLQFRTVAYHHYLDRAWTKFNGFQDKTNVHQLLQTNPESGQGAVYLAVLRGEESSTTEGQRLQIGTNDRQFHSFGVQSAMRWQWYGDKTSSSLDAGVRLHGDNVTRLHTEQSYNMVAGETASVQLVDNSNVVLLDSFATARALAVYVYEDFRYGKVHLFPSSRVEVVQGQRQDEGSEAADPVTRTTLLPGFGALVDLTDWSDVFASAHRGFSPVSPGQAAEVQPEVSWNYEAGFRLDEGSLHVEAIGFFNDYENLTGQCTFSGGCTGTNIDQQFNGGEVWIYGAEAVLGKQFLLSSGLVFPIEATYTFTQSTFQTGFTSGFPQFGRVQIGDSLPYSAKHQGNLNVGVRKEAFHSGVGLSYRSGMLDEAGAFEETTDIPAMLLVDAALSVRLRKQVNVYATGSNLTNSKAITSWRPYGARPVAPLQVMVGVKWDQG